MKKLILIIALASSLFADGFNEMRCINALKGIGENLKFLNLSEREGNMTKYRHYLGMIDLYNDDCIIYCDYEIALKNQAACKRQKESINGLKQQAGIR